MYDNEAAGRILRAQRRKKIIRDWTTEYAVSALKRRTYESVGG